MPKSKKVENIKSNVDKQISSSTYSFAGKTNGKMLGQDDLQQFLGCTPSDVRQLVADGCPKLPDPRKSGKFLFNSALVLNFIHKRDLDNVVEIMQAAEPELNDAMEAAEADRRYKVAKAAREELALANERAKVANIEEMVSIFDNVASNIAGNLRSWPNRLPGRLAHKDEKFIADTLDKELENVLNILCDLRVSDKE